jgi:hypothetical protein
MEKMAHIKPILCVFGTLFYSSGYTAPEMHHQQANIIPFVHLLNIQSKASMHKRSKNNAKRAPKIAPFFAFFSSVRGGWRSYDFVAPQAGSTALGIHGADSNALKMVI